MDDAREYILEDVLGTIREFLEELTDLKVTVDMREELREALAPLLETMSMLPCQRWQYGFDMVPAIDRGHRIPFDPSKMDGMFAEKTGMVRASLFPELSRLEWNEQDQVSCAKDHLSYNLFTLIQDFDHTVVCKARVAVKSEPSSTREDIGEDTVMSDGIDDDEAKTELEATENLEASVIKKSSESVELQGIQNEDQDDTKEGDSGEHMDEGPTTDALRTGIHISVERLETPERRLPEVIILDSFDRDEEETIDQGRRWPA